MKDKMKLTINCKLSFIILQKELYLAYTTNIVCNPTSFHFTIQSSILQLLSNCPIEFSDLQYITKSKTCQSVVAIMVVNKRKQRNEK